MSNQLAEAVKAKDADRARALVKEDPSLAAERDEEGLLPATQALYRGQEDLARELLPPDEALSVFEAASFARRERVDQLLTQDPQLAKAWSPDGFTVLHLSLFSGDEPTVRAVLERRPDLEAGARGTTAKDVKPIHTAAFVRNVKLAEVLIDAGADVNSREARGFTALHAAAENKDTEMVRMLLRRGADPTARDDKGRTPVGLADEVGAPGTAAVLPTGGREPAA